MTRVVLAIMWLSGCNQILGLGDPSLELPDPSIPSCATGWRYRAEIAVDNESPGELDDYQLMIVADTHALIAAGKLQPTGADLRFTSDAAPVAFAQTIESGLDTAATVIWIEAPVVPVGASTIELYYGNPSAAPLVGSPFVQAIIANASFEELGGWTVDPPIGPHAEVGGDNFWATDGVASFAIDEEVNGVRSDLSQASIHQPVTFPEGTDYVIRLDVEVLAASNGGPMNADDGSFFLSLGDGLEYIWRLSGTQNITGIHLEQETHAFGPGSVPLTFGTQINSGSNFGYASGYIDNLRVRKQATPAPTVTVGSESPACAM